MNSFNSLPMFASLRNSFLEIQASSDALRTHSQSNTTCAPFSSE